MYLLLVASALPIGLVLAGQQAGSPFVVAAALLLAAATVIVTWAVLRRRTTLRRDLTRDRVYPPKAGLPPPPDAT